MTDNLNDIRQVFRKRISELGQTPTAISRAATSKPDMLRKFLSGDAVPGADRLRSVAEYMGLEFYIGPPRSKTTTNTEISEVDANILARAIYTVEKVVIDDDIEASRRKRTAVIVEMYNQLRNKGEAKPEDVRKTFQLVS